MGHYWTKPFPVKEPILASPEEPCSDRYSKAKGLVQVLWDSSKGPLEESYEAGRSTAYLHGSRDTARFQVLHSNEDTRADPAGQAGRKTPASSSHLGLNEQSTTEARSKSKETQRGY